MTCLPPSSWFSVGCLILKPQIGIQGILASTTQRFTSKRKEDMGNVSISFNRSRINFTNTCVQIVNALAQACTTYGPRAKCGPRRLFIRPHTSKNLFSFYLVCSLETPSERVKNIIFGSWIFAKRNFWPAMRFELCTPALAYAIWGKRCNSIANNKIVSNSFSRHN